MFGALRMRTIISIRAARTFELSHCFYVLLVLTGALQTVGMSAEADDAAQAPVDKRRQLEHRARELHRKSERLFEKREYAAAIKPLEEAIAIRRRLYPKDNYPNGHLDLADALNDLGLLYVQQRDFARALRLYQEAATMVKRLFPTEKYRDGHPFYAQNLTNIGELLKQRRAYSQALPYLERALAMRERLYPRDKFPEGQEDLAFSLYTLGVLWQERGDHAKALRFHDQALAMYRRLTHKESSPRSRARVARSLNDIGTLHFSQGEFDRALSCFEQSLTIDEQLYPSDRFPDGHPALALGLSNVSEALSSKGEYAKALPYLERAFAVRQRLYPPAKYPDGQPDLALSLSNLGSLLEAQGKYDRALLFLQQALAMRKRLYPPDAYPLGHPDLLHSLNNLASVFAGLGDYSQARICFEQSLAMGERLYPKTEYPQGHPWLAQSMSSLGFILSMQDEHAKAIGYFERALAMRRGLYPKDKFPNGHPQLAVDLSNLGGALFYVGEDKKALLYLEQAVAMREALYPQDKYPAGHPVLARSLDHLAYQLQTLQEYDTALPYCRRALAMRESLYSEDKYPTGHPDLAESLGHLAELLSGQRKHAEAVRVARRALAMQEKLHPKTSEPRGNPTLAEALLLMADVLSGQDDEENALAFYERGLAMFEELFPKNQYPHGHRRIGEALRGAISVLLAREQYARAFQFACRECAIYQDLADLYAPAVSETEALNFVARDLPIARDSVLSTSRHVRGSEAASYSMVWRGKATVARVLHRRQQALLQSHDPQIRQLWQQLLETRRRLARLLLAPATNDEAQRERLQTQTQHKEDLERQLAMRLPSYDQRKTLDRLEWTDLVEKLPARTAFVDLISYWQYGPNPKRQGVGKLTATRSYVGFVLRRGQAVERVELGPAGPIEAALTQWRRQISQREVGLAARTLRRLVGDPIVRHLATDTNMVWLSPDAALTALPWAALPGQKDDTVLLEQYALAIVPHGPFLLECLMAVPPPDKESGRLLIVGGVNYDAEPRPVVMPQHNVVALRSAELRDAHIHWPGLPGTKRELERIVAAASGRPVLERRGNEASATQLLVDLSDRRDPPRWAHLATHGFFADKHLRSILQLDQKLFERDGSREERAAAGARNPMVLSGLVLAGGNRPVEKDQYGVPETDGGILTAEALAGLPLERLELVVLSACETGLGEVAGGEGVFGLQRAFHLAGARTVVASLWKIPDQATQALMERFYTNLWRRKLSKIEALREAQLWMLREAPRQSNWVRGLDLPADEERSLRTEKRLPPFYWAAFVLSGDWR